MNNFFIIQKMFEEELRVLFKHVHMEGENSKQIKEEMDSVHDHFAPLFETVYYLVNQFKSGRTITTFRPLCKLFKMFTI